MNKPALSNGVVEILENGIRFIDRSEVNQQGGGSMDFSITEINEILNHSNSNLVSESSVSSDISSISSVSSSEFEY